MKSINAFILPLAFLFSSCAPETQIPSSAEIVSVYATSAAGPWLSEAYLCANELSVILNVDSQAPDVYLRVGEPQILVSPAYQIDQEEILVVTHRDSPVQNLPPEQVQALFAGQGEPSMQVWVYASGADVQEAFDQLVMNGRPVNSFARVATSPLQMIDALNAGSSAVGILPRRWMTGGVREVYSAGVVPVLAIINAEPAGATRELIACLQK